MEKQSLDASYFERIYANDTDPWSFASSPYEARKYAASIKALGDAPYRRALEIGCSIGVFTKLLAERCEELLSVDIDYRALEQARARCASSSNVRFDRLVVPREFPSGTFDLIVLSEVGYYWSDDDLALARDRMVAAAPGGIVELVHYLPNVPEYVRDGDAVHAAFLADERFEAVRAERDETYRIDILRVR